jgi:hypothetical protein
MAQAPLDLGQRIVHAARLATVMHIRAVINETVVARRMQGGLRSVGRSVEQRRDMRITPPTPPARGAA